MEEGGASGWGLLVEEDGNPLELGVDGSVPHPVGKDGQEEVKDGETEQNLRVVKMNKFLSLSLFSLSPSSLSLSPSLSLSLSTQSWLKS